MRTLEEYFIEESKDLDLGTSKALLDQQDDQLMLLAKVDDTLVTQIKTDCKLGSVISSAFHIEGKSEILGIQIASLEKSSDKSVAFILPLQNQVIENLRRVVKGERMIIAAIVGENNKEVYGVDIFKEQLSKMTLEGKLEYILSGQIS